MNAKQKWIPLALVCALLLTMVGGAALMLLGTGDTRVTFAHESGDAAAWQGFAIPGTAGDARYQQQFVLKNGEVENHLELNPQTEGQNVPYVRFYWAMLPEDREQADAAAAYVETYGIGGYETMTRRAVCMAELTLAEGGAVRINTGYVAELEIDIPWFAYAREKGKPTRDYVLRGGEDASAQLGALPPSTSPGVSVGENVGENTYFALPDLEGGQTRIYRVDDALTARELRTQAPTCTVQGSTVVCHSSGYGEVTELTTLGEGTELLSLCGAPDALCAITRRGAQRRLITILLDGRVGDALDLVLPEDFGDSRCRLYETRESSEIAFSFESSPGDSVEGFSVYGAYRIREGKFAEGKTITLPFDKEGMSAESILLDEAGTRLLIAQMQIRTAEVTYGENTFPASYRDGLHLAIYDEGKKQPIATGSLRCNEPMDSARSNLPSEGGYERWQRFSQQRSLALSSCEQQTGFIFFGF